MTATTISTKFQIVIPKEVREELSLSPQDKLEISLSPDRTYLIVRPVVRDWSKHARGLGKKFWQKVDTDRYHQEFRQSLERNK